MAKVSTIYRVIKSEADDREFYYNSFLKNNPAEAARIWNFHNHNVTDCVNEYRKNGGKRHVEQYLREDK